jgi:hypothetical protein
MENFDLARAAHLFNDTMIAMHEERSAAKSASKLAGIADAINAAKIGLKTNWWKSGDAERVYVTRNGKKAGFIEAAGEKFLHRECSDETRLATKSFRTVA